MSDNRCTPHLHAADEPEIVRAPAVHYVSIRGSGAPGTDAFYRKKAAVAEVARALHDDESDPVVELQYWYPAGSTPVEIADFYSVNPIPSLQYRVLAMVPADTTTDDLAAARARVASPSKLDEMELFALPEQDVVQVMHHGPFAEEFGTLARLGRFAEGLGLHRSGPHHELHLDGFTRDTPQQSLRTILRDPVA
ncbi:GyrI-like domain-containing protein [Modestobacter sp. VKM Ac-2978]|uniref:GyrI-like domain-containing protein n=1 Tax=Modestobacter sp. VKM Ac-2978 TaxID=3004132 RepID=UPI0022AA0D6F|nr:GyrI-like domain-containing protein [Modestobacter sp. VKM Ac-2978]MCZ2848525.1 GyrI-like domain-containing protein [Modestobacter sp. VKM Ac-2978]